jgi:CubicO group peptidase (beta-lactamase class C family)
MSIFASRSKEVNCDLTWTHDSATSNGNTRQRIRDYQVDRLIRWATQTRGFGPLVRFWILALALLLNRPCAGQAPPLTGAAAPEYVPLDEAVLAFMKRIHCRAATAAVSRNGKLVFSRGYGWSDAHKKKPTAPNSLMRISGLTRPITAAAIKKLIQEGKLTLDTKVYPLLNLKPPRGSDRDPRLAQITVEHLLTHKGGWDVKTAVDPFARLGEIGERLGLSRRPRSSDVVRYMLTEPLQFDPGARSVDSAFGYCVLGRVIEKASGKLYGAYIAEDLFKPLRVVDVKLARDLRRERDPREVSYPVSDVPVEVMDSCAGLVASAPALCGFLDRYWVSGESRRAGQVQQWTFFGNFPSTTAIVRQRADGFNIAVLCNGRRDESSQAEDNSLLARLVEEAMDQIAAASVR